MKKLYPCLFISLFFSTLSYGQDIVSNAAGFSLNLNPSYASWRSESVFLGSLDDLEPTGLGVYAKVGYGITQQIEVFLGYGVEGFKRKEDWDTYRNSTFDIGARFNFGATLKAFRPFLEAALSRNDLTIDPIVFDNGTELFNLNVKGFSFTAGAGLHYFVQRNLSITAMAKASFGSFDEVYLSGEEIVGFDETLDLELYRIHLGMTYFFE